MQSAAYHEGRTRSGGRGTDYTRGGPLEALPDDQLIAKCRADDRAAFDVLIRRYERPIYHLAYRLSGNYDDSHEIAAETFMRIYRAIGTFQCAITLPAWINRIVANVYFDMRRRAHRHPAVSLDALMEKAGDSVLATDSYEREATSPYAIAERSERRRILESAIAELPDYQRTMVALFHSQGRTYEEIAAIMSIPVGTVKSRLNRARLALREILQPQASVLMS